MLSVLKPLPLPFFPSNFASFHSWLWTQLLAGVVGVGGESSECCQFHNHSHHLPSNLFFIIHLAGVVWVGGPRPGGECRPGHQDHPVEEQAWAYYLGSEYYQDQNIIKISILSRSEHFQDQNIIKIRILFRVRILSRSTYYLDQHIIQEEQAWEYRQMYFFPEEPFWSLSGLFISFSCASALKPAKTFQFVSPSDVFTQLTKIWKLFRIFIRPSRILARKRK